MKHRKSDYFDSDSLERAKQIISQSNFLVAFTGAGISVESGIPPFRGEGGIWEKYDPHCLEISYFHRHPEKAWSAIRAIFYENFKIAQPNTAHLWLANLEKSGKLKGLITQNIDDLHYRAGSRQVAEFHGNSRLLRCPKTNETVEAESVDLSQLPPLSAAGGIYKPDFVFFGEAIPRPAADQSTSWANQCDCMIIIGTSGEVYPAAGLPTLAKQNGATIIEINPAPSNYTAGISDIFLGLNATEAVELLT
jgi:NAD-dependent deacetylase